MQPQPNHAQAPDGGPIRCRRCPSDVVVRLKKTRRRDNDVYRCTGCGLIFSPGSTPAKTSLSQPQDRPNNQEVRHES